jgi:hypothetical protein
MENPKLVEAASAAQEKRAATGLGWAAALSAAVTALLLYYSGSYGYMSDELYFLACAEHPAWGYADLPPLLPWLTWITVHTIGSSLVAIRLYPALAAGAAVWIAAKIAAELGGGRRAVILAAVLVASSPILIGVGHILSTNALDYPLWALAVLLLVRIEKSGEQRVWIAFGVVVALSLLHKYTMAFFIAALLVALLLTAWRRYFLSRWFWAGTLLATLMVLPNVIWQAQAQFPFLELQHHGAVTHRNVVLPPLQFVLAQALLANLVSFAIAMAGMVFCFTPAMRRYRALGYTFLGFFLLMFALHARDYYLGGIYPAMFALGAVAMERWFGGRWAWRGVLAYILLAVAQWVVLVPSMLPVFSPERLERYYKSLPIHRTEPENWEHSVIPDYIADQFGWQERVEMVARYYNSLPAEERAQTAILGWFYGQAGAVDHFGPPLGLPKAISGHHSYWYFGPRGYHGRSVIFMDFRKSSLDKHCASVTLVGEHASPLMREMHNQPIFHCRGLDYDITAEWADFRHID